MNPEADREATQGKALIAVLDDEADICRALRRLLRSVGYEAVTFSSGQEFLQSLSHRQPDCLILDLHLPGLTGMDVHRHLIATRANFPIVIITGRDEPGLGDRMMSSGAAAFLLKPVNETELVGTLSRLLCKKACAHA